MTRRFLFVAGVSISVVAACAGGRPTESQVAARPRSEAPSENEAAPSSAASVSHSEDTAAEESHHRHPGAVPRDGSNGTKAPAKGAPLDEIMRAHFADAERIRDAVIAGRPQDTGKPAVALIHLFEVSALPSTWVEPVKRMQVSAQRVDDSSDIAGVAAAVADLGVSCAGCHQKVGGPHLKDTVAPPSDGSVESLMRRHAWAVDRLWEGLYVPSDNAWTLGATMLRDSPFPLEGTRKGGVYAKAAAVAFNKIVSNATDKRTAAERATTYAELIGTCATCHVVTD